MSRKSQSQQPCIEEGLSLTGMSYHELGQIDLESLLRVVICEDTIVGQRPSERICNDHNHAFRGTIWCISNVAVQAVDFLDLACWDARVQ